MRELIDQLKALRAARDAGEFIKKEEFAYRALDVLQGNLRDEIIAARNDIGSENCHSSIERRTEKFYAKIAKKQTPPNLDDLIAEAPAVEHKTADAPKVKPTEEEIKIQALERVRRANQAKANEFKKIAYDLLDEDSNAHIGWIEKIPDLLLNAKQKKRKKASKALLHLINITSQRNVLAWETVDSLRRQVTLTKSYSALKELQEGEEIAGFKFPTLKERLKKALEREGVVDPEEVAKATETFEKHLAEKFTYLSKKRLADKFAKGVNFIVSVLGVGLVGALAFVTLLPLLGFVPTFPVAIGIVAGMTLLGGYTEAFVYYEYVKKFFRQLVVGFFDGIDNTVLNRESFKEGGQRDRHTLTPTQIQNIKDKFVVELTVKKTLLVLSFLVAAASGIGYMGLLFTEVVGFLPAALLASTPALIAVPWLLAAVVGIGYGVVIAGMLNQAIKHNYFLKIVEHCKNLYSFDKAPEGRSYPAHVALCILKTLGLAIVVGFSVVAIFATAGLWLKNSVEFFSTALHLVDKLATGIGMAIWGIYVVTMLWFCAEKSLVTLDSLTKIKWENLKESARESFSSPKKFFSFLCNAVLMVFHIASNCSVAALGAEAKVANKMIPDLESILPGNVAPRVAGAVGDAGSEIFIDAGDALGLNHHHHHSSYAKLNLGKFYTKEKKDHEDNHAGHSHGNIVKFCEKGGKAVMGLFASKEKAAPKPIGGFDLRARNI